MCTSYPDRKMFMSIFVRKQVVFWSVLSFSIEAEYTRGFKCPVQILYRTEVVGTGWLCPCFGMENSPLKIVHTFWYTLYNATRSDKLVFWVSCLMLLVLKRVTTIIWDKIFRLILHIYIYIYIYIYIHTCVCVCVCILKFGISDVYIKIYVVV